jgi:O-antigen/teichoic acid export membrane protein
MRGYLERLVRTGGAYTASSVISKLFAVALLPVYTRHLTRADYGAAEVLLAFVVAASIILRLGIIEALLRFYYTWDEKGRRDEVVSSAAVLLLVTTTVGALVVLPFAAPLSELLLGRSEPGLMRIAIGGLWVFSNYELLMALFRLDERAAAFFTASIVNVLLTIALTLWLVVGQDEGARGLLLGNFVASAIVLAALFWLQRHRLRLARSPATLRPMLRFGLPTMPAELSLYALNLVDRVVLARVSGLAAAGLYSLAVKFSQVVTVLVRGFNLAWPPLAYSIRDDEEARRTYAVIVTYYVLVSFTVVLALSLEARWVARALAAPEFFDSYEAVPLVATGAALYALYLVLVVAVGRTGRTEFNFPVTATAAAVNLGLNLLLVPPYDIVGAGIALVGSYVVMLALMQVVSRRLFPVPFEWWRLVRIIGLAAATFALGEVFLPTSGIDGFVLRALLVPAYVGALYVSGFFRPEELRGARDVAAGISARLGGRSAQAPEDLVALRSRADLVDEVHDPQ